jgi:alanine-glyoxylate transaminase / serine-glyoxylate transaminase / serine-pyruvate transaminase
MQIPPELNTSQRILLGPGPSNVHPRVLRAMAQPLVGHLDPQFVAIMDEVRAMLRVIMRTSNEMTFAISAPGSAGMEAALVNLLEPGDEALICVHGVFGGRMADIGERCDARVSRVDAEWGRPIEPCEVKKALSNLRPKLVAIVHAETSTGVRQPLEEIGRLAREAGALFVVDAVTSLGGIDVRTDDWGIDVLYSGTQKCLSAPPGLSPITFSERALDAVAKRKTKVRSWFLDVSLLRNYWSGGQRAYHHTAPVSMAFALREALRIVLEEGLEARFARHQKNHEILRDALAELGFSFLVEREFRLPELNAVLVPDGIDEAAVRRRLLDEYDIEVGGGLGPLAGRIWRIGLMGESSSLNHINALTGALRTILPQAATG